MNEWIFRLIILILGVMSPEFRKALELSLSNLETEAKKTQNPWDDILVGMLKTLLISN